MTLQGEYEPSPAKWVRNQVEKIESSGGTKGTTLNGVPVVVVTSTGAKSGKLRKTPLMRVEHGGVYALVASLGGSDNNPVWFHNLVAHPTIELQDGPDKAEYAVRVIEGEERERWWERAVEVWPDYANYQTKTDRVIPLFLAERA